jgi:hypothetical protein
VVVSDFVLDEDGAGPRQAEYAAWLGAAGLVDVARVRLPGPAHLLFGRKPAG